MALIAVLWVLLLLSVMAASFLAQMRSSAQRADWHRRAIEAEMLADAGFVLGLQWLLDARREIRQQADGRSVAADLAGGAVQIAIQDESGKIDLNFADHELLASLFLSQGPERAEADALADAVEDFRDADSLRRAHGAEDDDYRLAGWPAGAKDAPFAAIDELRQVRGVAQALFEKLAPLLTVQSGRLTVNPRTAPGGVLRALPGAAPAEIDAYLAARPAIGIGGALPRITGRAAQFLFAGASQVFSIRIEARASAGGVFVREAIVRLGPARPDGTAAPYEILAWAQGRGLPLDTTDDAPRP